MPHHSIARFAWLVSLTVLTASCDKPSADKPAPVAAAPSNPAPAPPASSAGKTSAEAPAPSASAAPEKPADEALVGTWEGRYEAKKGEVEMPARVKDKVRSKDDGKTAIGAGTVKLIVNKDNEIEGFTEGALGAASLRGKIEDGQVRAMFYPSDALDKNAMFGILSGARKDDKIEARIRVASGDASVVREADFVLRKKP